MTKRFNPVKNNRTNCVASPRGQRRLSLKAIASLSVPLLAPTLSACQTAVTSAQGRNSQVQDLDVPFITTPDNVVSKILEMASVGPNDFVLDLGSGDGRIPITAAKRFGARGLGVEIDPQLVSQSRLNAKAAGVDNLVQFRVQDLFDTDLSVASVITMYLLPDVNLKLRPKLQQLKPGTRIVSHDWDMGDWQPAWTQKVAAPDKKVGLIKESKIMLWVVK